LGRGDAGVGEELGDGEAGDGGVVGVGELGEAVEAHGDVVLGEEPCFLIEQRGADGSVGFVFFGVEELLDFVQGVAGGFEEGIELGGVGGGEGVVEVVGGGWRGAGRGIGMEGIGKRVGGGIGRVFNQGVVDGSALG